MPLNCDSDTESEPEFNSQLRCDLLEHGEIITSSTADVKAAVETLKRLEGNDIRQDAFHSEILKAANIIVKFLADPFAIGFLEGMSVRSCLDVFILIIHPAFLSLLFTYRKTFHSIAAQALPSGATVSTVVCWVDAVLAHLGEATMTIAGGTRRCQDSHPHDFENLRRQSEENNLRAAAQLPGRWQSVPGVISSERASPAAKRLALRLTFAVYIIRPQFMDCDPWSEGGVQSSDMMKILHTCITQLQVNNTLARTSPLAAELCEQEKSGYAMIVSLFASADSVHPKATTLSPFRPHSQAFLLRMIQLVLRPEDNCSSNLISPRKALGLAEIILVRWGSTVPWCWRIWGDQRIANIDYITYLTATWLFHLDDCIFESTSEEVLVAWEECLMPHLAQHPISASSGILQVLHHSALSLCSSSSPNGISPSTTQILSKCCWATLELLNLLAPDNQSFTSELCKCLCTLYSLLGITNGEIEIKYIIIETLTLVPPGYFRLAMESVLSDSSVPFLVKFDEVITRLKSTMFSDDGHFKMHEQNLHGAKLVLDFLTISWKNGSRGILHGGSLSLFLGSLVDHLSHEDPGSLPWTILCDSLLSTLATLEAVRSDASFCDVRKLWEDETLWQMVMKSKRSNLPVGAAFSRYIVFMPDDCDSFCCAEAWDYCRDLLLLIISRHFLGEDEPLALAVCPSICQALLRLLRLKDPQSVQFIVSSPWTRNLCADLQLVLAGGNDGSQADEYSSVLRERLDPIGRIMLDEIKRNLHLDTASPPLDIPEFDFRLTFCRLHPIPRLILCPGLKTGSVMGEKV